MIMQNGEWSSLSWKMCSISKFTMAKAAFIIIKVSYTTLEVRTGLKIQVLVRQARSRMPGVWSMCNSIEEARYKARPVCGRSNPVLCGSKNVAIIPGEARTTFLCKRNTSFVKLFKPLNYCWLGYNVVSNVGPTDSKIPRHGGEVT